jgi:chemotaxis protein MotB
MPGGRISATGYGDTRPLDPGSSPEALATNRRVDLVVHSSLPETVRGLIPAVVDGTAAPAAVPAPPAAPEATSETLPAAATDHAAPAAHDDDDDDDDDEGH